MKKIRSLTMMNDDKRMYMKYKNYQFTFKKRVPVGDGDSERIQQAIIDVCKAVVVSVFKALYEDSVQ